MAAGSSPGGEPSAPRPPPPSRAQGDWSGRARERQQIPFKILRGHSDMVSSCHFCFEDTKILSCSHDGTVKLWDVEKGSPIQVFDKEHTAPISERNLTPDNRRVVTSSYDRTVKAWDMETGKTLWAVEQEGLVTSCNISCDGRYVVSGSDKEDTIYVFDAVSATVVARIQGHHKSTITKCCFDPENQRVASVSYDKMIKLWDMKTRSTSIMINNNAISDCCFTSDGRYLCTASWDKSLKIWDIKTPEIECREAISLNQGHVGSVSSCLFSQDASLVVSGGYDKAVALWDAGAGCQKLSLKGHEDWVTDVAISKDKNWILSASKDYTLRLWNIEKMDHIPSAIEIGEARGSKIAQELQVGKVVGSGHVTAWNAVKLWDIKKCKQTIAAGDETLSPLGILCREPWAPEPLWIRQEWTLNSGMSQPGWHRSDLGTVHFNTSTLKEASKRVRRTRSESESAHVWIL